MTEKKTTTIATIDCIDLDNGCLVLYLGMLRKKQSIHLDKALLLQGIKEGKLYVGALVDYCFIQEASE